MTVVAAVTLVKNDRGTIRLIGSTGKPVSPGKDIAANAPEKWAPDTAETADHSLPYVVGRALLDGKITAHSYSEAALRDPALAALLKVTTVEEDPALSAQMPAKMPNRITITFADGRTKTEQVDSLPGFPGRPMQRADVEAKFNNNLGQFWSDAQRRRVLDACWALEEQADLGALMRSFAPA